MASWLFPVTFLAHLLEEYVAAEWFGAWSARVLGLPVSRSGFIAGNAVALALMCVGTALTIAHRRLRWIEIAIAIGVLGNALFHVVASAATLTYSPGLLTSVVLWMPLVIIRLPVAHRESSPRGRRIGIWVGASVAVVTLGVYASGLL